MFTSFDEAQRFKAALHERGWVDRETVRFYEIPRWTPAESGEEQVRRIRAAELDVVVAPTDEAVAAALRFTERPAVVMVDCSDPVGLGFVTSLAHPGGRVTGLSGVQPELSGKRVALLVEALSRPARAIVLYDPAAPTAAIMLDATQRAADDAGVTLRPAEVSTGSGLELSRAFDAVVETGSEAVIVLRDATTTASARGIGALALNRRLPAVLPFQDGVEQGALLAYSADEGALTQRAVAYVDRILRGARPSDLPVEQPTVFQFTINARTARDLQLTLPPSLLAQATQVIG
jgi:putative ABC transport system substrate-binding protein